MKKKKLHFLFMSASVILLIMIVWQSALLVRQYKQIGELTRILQEKEQELASQNERLFF